MHDKDAPKDQKALLRFLARDSEVQTAIQVFLGFGRSLPWEILDDDILGGIVSKIADLGSGHAAGLWYREQVPRRERARARAVLLNVSRQRREGLWVR